MRKRFAVGVLSATMAAALLGASGASAATEFGNNCTGDAAATEGFTLTTLESPGPLPLTAPSNGVVTKLRVNLVGSLPFSIPTAIKLLRSAGGTNYTVISQTVFGAGGGVTTADARMPALAGDRLGLYGQPFSFEGSSVPSISFYCKEMGAGSLLGAVKQDVQPGATASFPPAVNAQIPVVAVLEADADGDGYGDETQDKCPQGAATQLPCPVITLDTLNITGKNSVTVLVATSLAAPVKVAGIVQLGKGKKAKLKAKTKTALPGKFNRFKLPFNSALKEKLRELEPGKKLTLKITASATNIAGQVSTDKLKANLKGQG